MLKHRILWLTGMLLALCSCSDEKPEAILNESEIAFGEKLASISPDSGDVNRFYIGTEDGVVYVYHADNNHIDTLHTSFDRIYRVVRDNKEDSIFWVGTRNMGMFRCKLADDSLHAEKQYTIPARNKETKFSAYDISLQNEGIYVATSHGVFVVKEETESMMVPIFVEPKKEDPGYLNPVVYNCFKTCCGRLYCGGARGLKWIDIQKGDDTITCMKGNLKNIVVRGDSIFALCEKSLKIYDVAKEKERDSITLKHPAQLYFYDPMEGVNYLINDNDIQLFKDFDIKNPKEYKDVSIHRTLRPSTCHNIIVDDSVRQQSLLVSRNSIMRIGHHQDVFNSFGKIEYACTDKNSIYYLIGRKLYRQQTDAKGEKMEAFLCRDISKDVRFMTVMDDVLYYIDTDNKAYRVKLHGSYFWNSICSIWSLEKEIKPTMEKETTAIGKNRQQVFVGVRDGFCRLEKADSSIELSDENPFITAFTQDRNENMVLSTLNEGIFREKNGKFVSVNNTEKIQFIRDVAIDSKNAVWFLTNRHIYHQQEDSTFKVEYDAVGYSRLLLLNDNPYGIGEHGIHSFKDSTDYLVDVVFNPNACVALNGKLYCGSGNGVYVFDNHNKGGMTVKFNDAFKPFSRTNILIFLVLLLVIIIGFWYYDRFRLSRRSILSHKKDLVERIANLTIAEAYLSEETNRKISDLSREVANINASNGKKALAEVQRLSKEIQRVTASVPFELRPKLMKSAEDIKKGKLPGWESYVRASEEAVATHSISQIVFQLNANASLMEKVAIMQQRLERYIVMFDYSPSRKYAYNIEGVTSKVKAIVISDELDIFEKNAKIDEIIGSLSTDHGKSVMAEYISEQLRTAKKLERQSQDDPIISNICSKYNEHLSQVDTLKAGEGMLQFLEKLLLTNQRLCVMQELITIRQQVEKTFGRLKMLEKERAEDKRNGVSDPWKEERQWKEKESIEGEIPEVPGRILRSIERLYDCLHHCCDWQPLAKMDLKVSNQEGKIFPLMLTIPKNLVPFEHYCDLLGGNQKSLYRAKTKLEGLLSVVQDDIKSYAEQEPASISCVIVRVFA